MFPAEFEEKEFEVPLLAELTGSPGYLWSPGQVLESILGFDGAVLADVSYWSLVRRKPKPTIPLASVINPVTPLTVPIGSPVGGPLVPGCTGGAVANGFGKNLFLQVKRPFWYPLGSAPNPIAAACITAPAGGHWYYFRRKVAQQTILEGLHTKLCGAPGRNAVAEVCYASPVFHTRANLVEYTHSRKLVKSTCFPLAVRMKGHKRIAYCEPGGTGFALSIPEPFPLQSIAELFSPESATQKIESQLLHRQLNEIYQALKESIDGNLKKQFYLPDEETPVDFYTMPLELKYAVVRANLESIGLHWLVAGVMRRYE